MSGNGIDTWIFDLDNTLYPADAALFGQVSSRIEAYVSRFLSLPGPQARDRQRDYFHRHGTTLRGLMVEHGCDPHDYLAYVHDIDITRLTPDPKLRRQLAGLPGRRFIFTNADTPYAERVLEQLGLAGLFEAIHDVHASDYLPKPRPEPYRQLVETHALDARRCVFVEDMRRNLLPAKALGMTTVWIDNASDQGPKDELGDGHVDMRAPCVVSWLDRMLPAAA